jgi:uncharacterized protein DUF2752
MTPSRRRVADVLRAAVPLAVIAFATAMLLCLPPEQYAQFYPQCPIYSFLHLQCPGCGTTRALAALLHGHVFEALRFNALTTLLTPPAAIYAALCYVRFLQRKPLSLPQPSPSVIYAALSLAALFTLLRNV